MSEPDPVQLRPARAGDAETLGRCHLECWRETYTGLVDGAALAVALARVDERVERWRQILTGRHGTVVAVAGEEVVGFASAGPQRDDDLDLDLELYALYVRRARWDTGLGHRLLTATVGDAASSLWVLHGNVRARRFYGRHGYQPDGTDKHEPSLDALEIRMVRPAPEDRSGP